MYREKKIPIPVAERSKSRVYGRSLAGIAGSNPVGSVCVSLFYCVLSGYGPSEGPIPRPEESHQLWLVIVCDLETSRIRRPLPAMG